MLKWLHISDLHYNIANYSSKKMRDKLLDDLKNQDKLDFIVITGDLAYQGKSYKEIEKFIRDIIEATGIEKENMFIVPGNHDLKRNNVRNVLIKDLVNKPSRIRATEELDQETFKIISKAQNSFWSFYTKVTGKKYVKKDIHFIEEREEFNIISLNTALLCSDIEDQGGLSIFISKLYNLLSKNKDSDKYNIAIGHHNIDYFFEEEQSKIYNNFSDNNIDFYMCGHSHKPKVFVDSSNEKELYVLRAGAVVSDGYAVATYSIGTIEYNTCEVKYFSWDEEDERWIKETKGLGRRTNDGIVSFDVKKNNKNNIIENEIEIELDEFREFIVNFHENIESKKNVETPPIIQEDIERKFENMVCNRSFKNQFSDLSKYFPIVDDIMRDNKCLGMEKRLVIPNVILEEYNNVFEEYSNGAKILEAIVSGIYKRYRGKFCYSENKLKVYIKTLVFWLINECDIFDDNKIEK
jgi:predicted MPP superfamily phosphohydrolase